MADQEAEAGIRTFAMLVAPRLPRGRASGSRPAPSRLHDWLAGRACNRRQAITRSIQRISRAASQTSAEPPEISRQRDGLREASRGYSRASPVSSLEHLQVSTEQLCGAPSCSTTESRRTPDRSIAKLCSASRSA